MEATKSMIFVIAPAASKRVTQQLIPIINCVTENQLQLLKVDPETALTELTANFSQIQAVLFAGVADDSDLFEKVLAKTAGAVTVCVICFDDRSLIEKFIKMGLTVILDCQSAAYAQHRGCYCLQSQMALRFAFNLIGEGES